MIHVDEIGAKAWRALAAARTRPTVVAALSRSLYLDVGGELFWLGPSGSTPHSRAMLAAAVPAAVANTALAAPLDLRHARRWRTPPLPRTADVDRIRSGRRDLLETIGDVGRADGFGALLVGRCPEFPLASATADARTFLQACAVDEAGAAAAAGARLLGLGPGLTPAGDDLVGGALFARRWLGDGGRADAAGWMRAADHLRSLAAWRTNRISAVLLGDLCDGDAYGPLHDLAIALAGGAPTAVSLDAARRLTRIGHSSGWDMLTGFLGALG